VTTSHLNSTVGMVMSRARRREPSSLPAQSLEELFVQHYTRLCQLAVRMLGDPMRAEDVVMDAFLEVHRVVDRLDWQTAPAYVRRAVVNRALRVLSRATSEERLVDRAARERLLPAEVGHGVDQQEISAERDRVLLAIAELPPREKVAIVLSYYEDLPLAQIAAAMGCREGTVKRYLSQARARLTERLGQVTS
jgi:RNA polymerase sigma factor (sigma-70 family)